MKKIIVALMILGMLLASGKVFAQMMPGKGMKNHEARWPGRRMSKDDEVKKEEMGMEEMFYHKLKMIWRNSEELGIKEDQMQAIKDLKNATKKDLIMKKAQIQVIGVDLKSKMTDDPMNEKAVNDLLDKKYELKKAKAKALVNACVLLRKILTEEQKGKMKKLLSAKMDEKTDE